MSFAERRPTLYDIYEKPDDLKAMEQSADFEDIPDNQMKLVDAEMMRRIETRVYCLLREVLEMDKMNIVRRQVLALLRRTLRMFFTSSMAEWISSKYQLYRKDAHITMLIQFIRETVWPNGVLIQRKHPRNLDIFMRFCRGSCLNVLPSRRDAKPGRRSCHSAKTPAITQKGRTGHPRLADRSRPE